MVTFIKELARNLIQYHRESKRIENEINTYGVEYFVKKYYGNDSHSSDQSLKSAHAKRS